jgi:hypothetical protein
MSLPVITRSRPWLARTEERDEARRRLRDLWQKTKKAVNRDEDEDED